MSQGEYGFSGTPPVGPAGTKYRDTVTGKYYLSDGTSWLELVGIGPITDTQHGSRGASLHSDSHTRLHTVTVAADHSFPGGTSTFLRADGTFATPPGAGVPNGTIALWSPLNGAVPTGWAECDGTANSPGPDLRDKFIVGRGTNHTVDTSGGASTHGHSDNLTHSGAAVANHVVTQPDAHTTTAAHSHKTMRFPTATGGLAGHTADTSMSGTQVATDEDTTTVGDASVVHSGSAVDAHGVTQPSAHGSHAAVNHEPIWYALIYIQKMS